MNGANTYDRRTVMPDVPIDVAARAELPSPFDHAARRSAVKAIGRYPQIGTSSRKSFGAGFASLALLEALCRGRAGVSTAPRRTFAQGFSFARPAAEPVTDRPHTPALSA